MFRLSCCEHGTTTTVNDIVGAMLQHCMRDEVHQRVTWAQTTPRQHASEVWQASQLQEFAELRRATSARMSMLGRCGPGEFFDTILADMDAMGSTSVTPRHDVMLVEELEHKPVSHETGRRSSRARRSRNRWKPWLPPSL